MSARFLNSPCLDWSVGGNVRRRKSEPAVKIKNASLDAKVLFIGPCGPSRPREQDTGSQLLASVSYVGTWDRKKGRHLAGFHAVSCFAGLHPSEAVGLRRADCFLPEKGWGVLTLHGTHPVSGKQWTDSGE